MAEYTSADVVSAAIDKDVVGIKAAMDDVLTNKIADAIDMQRPETIADMFGTTPLEVSDATATENEEGADEDV